MSDYVFPVLPSAKVTSRFGIRIHPISRAPSFHPGVDLAIAAGSPVYAAKPGTVIKAGVAGSYGNLIIVQHENGISTRYAHLSRFNVKQGDKVNAGQRIGSVGSTGNSTGPHLHFEIRVNNKPIDPLPRLDRNNISLSQEIGKTVADVVKKASKNKKRKITGFKGKLRSSSGSSGSSASSSSGNGSIENEAKEITGVVKFSEIGRRGSNQSNIVNAQSDGKGLEIIIQNDKIYNVIVNDDVTLDWERGAPGVLNFKVVKDPILNIREGNPVRLRYNGKDIFAGFLFTKSRSDKTVISCTAYDQMRYLKNKDSLSYSNKKYSDVIKMIAADYGLKVGEIEDTGYVIPHRIEEGTLLDIIANASDLTISHTGKMYIFYDNVGRLTLKSLKSMLLPLLITEDTAGGYSYTSSIDENVYNRIKLAYDNDQTGRREVYITNDPDKQNRWGVLQLYEKVDTKNEIKLKADTLLKYHSKIRRSLTISDCLGDIRVRAGSLVVVKMGLGDINVQNYMLVEHVKHTFRNGEHFMELELSGIRGEFNV